MQIDINNLVSITEANQNFSKVARMVDEKGSAIILKNNTPKYVLLDYSVIQENTEAEDQTVDEVASKILNKYKPAFEELSK